MLGNVSVMCHTSVDQFSTTWRRERPLTRSQGARPPYSLPWYRLSINLTTWCEILPLFGSICFRGKFECMKFTTWLKFRAITYLNANYPMNLVKWYQNASTSKYSLRDFIIPASTLTWLSKQKKRNVIWFLLHEENKITIPIIVDPIIRLS